METKRFTTGKTVTIITFLVGIIVLLSGLFSYGFYNYWQESKKSGPSPIVTVTSPTTYPSPSVSPSIALTTPLPSPLPSTSPTAKSVATAIPSTASSIPPTASAVSTTNSLRLAVPFTVQAPDGDWSEPWGEGCEEAVLLMVDAFNKGNKTDILPIVETKAEIARMVDWEKSRFGGHLDLGLNDIAAIARDYMGYKADKVRIKSPATLDDIKAELVAGRPVIIPAAGQKLYNPYFKQPGPPYHALVLIGFEKDNFIANENGTKRGRGYIYSREILEGAIRDLTPGKSINDGPMAYLVLDI